MIPEKLYIPTSTLNFNNILASESISPAGFYSLRGFGYKRFEKVEPNNLDKRIILYEKYPIFDIDDKELENEPLVIEINTNFISEEIIQIFENGIYFSEETLYLNPFLTFFYFRNETEKRSVLSKVEQSLNTKLVYLYQNHFRVKPTTIESFRWQHNEIEDSKSDFSKHISKDRLINKLKGFIYAYLLGANKSISSEIVAVKKYAKELRNVISAVITSSDGRANYNQDKQITRLYELINNSFYKAEGLNNKLREIIHEKIEKYHCDNFENILKDEGLYDIWFQRQGIKSSFQLQNFNFHSFYKSPYDKKNDNENQKAENNQKYFDYYFTELDSAINRYVKPQNIDCSKLPHIQHYCRIESIPDQKDFLVKLFNEFLSENWNSEEFLNSRLDFATAGGKLFKEELQSSWENSKYKTYINNLRNNLASFTPFELDTDNLTLKSFASFCQKGEEDIDKLEDYLISNGIGDFRIAFGLWGIIFGFANMPKTLTNELFMSDNSDYISQTYKYIFKQIHGIELKGEIENIIIEEKTSFRYQEDLYSKEETKQSSINKQKDINQENKIQENTEEQTFRKNLKIQKIKQEDKVIEMWKDNLYLINEKLFISISKIQGIGKKSLEKIKECFNYRTIIEESVSKSMFSNVCSGNFLDDYEFLSNNQEFIKIVSNEKGWQKDLKWFISEYNNPYSKYYGTGSDKEPSLRDNKTVIQKFISLKKGIYKNTEHFLKSLYLKTDE